MSFNLGVNEFSKCSSLFLFFTNFCQVIVNEDSAALTEEFLTRRLNAIKSQKNTGEQEDLALVIGRRICNTQFLDSYVEQMARA